MKPLNKKEQKAFDEIKERLHDMSRSELDTRFWEINDQMQNTLLRELNKNPLVECEYDYISYLLEL